MRKHLLVLALGAVAYVVAGFYNDLPPRSVWLEGCHSRIEVMPKAVRVQTELTYVCTSWRWRRTQVYLPFARSGAVSEVVAEVDPLSSYQVLPDGVVVSLVMSPHSKQVARFGFVQGAEGSYEWRFGVSRGWPYPPNLRQFEVSAPSAFKLTFSAPVERREGETYRLSADSEGGLKLQW